VQTAPINLGVNFATLLFAAFLPHVGCSGPASESPTSPTPPAVVAPTPAQIAGMWIGRYRETSCSGDAPACSQRFKTGEPEFDFTLTVTQQGNQLTGMFDITPRPFEAHAKGALSGTASGTAVQLTGRLPWSSDQDPGVYGRKEIENFAAVADQASENMAGTFAIAHVEGDAFLRFRTQAQILRLAKQ
jgi:hypothetical protein